MQRPELASTARPDPYRVLDVPAGADAATITRAYWKLAKQFHPDRNGSALGQRLMLVVNEAYETLKNPERRAEWDRMRRATAGRGLAAAPSSPESAASHPVSTPPTPEPEPMMGAPAGPITRRMARQQSAADPGAGGRPGHSRPLEFGRYAGRTIREVARMDPDYVQWFIRTPLGRSYAAELTDTR